MESFNFGAHGWPQPFSSASFESAEVTSARNQVRGTSR